MPGGVVKSPRSAVAGLVEILTQIQDTEVRINQKADELQNLYDMIMADSSEDIDTFKEVEEALQELRQQLEDYKNSQGRPTYKVEDILVENNEITTLHDIEIEAVANRRSVSLDIFKANLEIPIEKVCEKKFKLLVPNEGMFDGLTVTIEYLL